MHEASKACCPSLCRRLVLTPRFCPPPLDSYIKQCLGSPTPAEYEAVVAERDGLQKQLEEANQLIAELQSRVGPRSSVGGWWWADISCSAMGVCQVQLST